MNTKKLALIALLGMTFLRAEDANSRKNPSPLPQEQPKQQKTPQLTPEQMLLAQQIQQLLESANPSERELGEYLVNPKGKKAPKLLTELQVLYFRALAAGEIAWEGPEANNVDKTLRAHYFAPLQEAQLLKESVLTPAAETIRFDKNMRLACIAFDLLWKWKVKGSFSTQTPQTSAGPAADLAQTTLDAWNAPEGSARRSDIEARFQTIEWGKRLFNFFKTRFLFPEFRKTDYAKYEPIVGLALNRAAEYAEKKVTPRNQSLMSNAQIRGTTSLLGTLFDTGLDLHGSLKAHRKLVTEKEISVVDTIEQVKKLEAQASEAKEVLMKHSTPQVVTHLGTLLDAHRRSQATDSSSARREQRRKR